MRSRHWRPDFVTVTLRGIPLEGREENIVFEVPKELRVDIREVD